VRRTILRLVLLLVLVILVVDRLAGPARSNPPVDPAQRLEAVAAPPERVRATLRRACYDCHSNETRWPWYARVPPASWLVARDVNEGRGEVNFSGWGGYTAARQARKLQEACELVEKGEMPLGIYLAVHREARLAPGDVREICEWAAAEARRLAPAGAAREGGRQ
jgi:hypothetical protein